jgi:hypothetical protein
MTVLLIADVVVAVALGVTAVLCLRIVNRRARETAAFEAELASTRQQLQETEASLGVAESNRLAAAERAAALQRLAETVAAAAASPGTTGSTTDVDTTAGPGSQDRRVLDAVWRLACLDVELERFRAAELSTAGLESGPVGLAETVEQEIARIREEIGTPGAFESDLPQEPEPAAALLLLRSVQSTLEFVARRCQAFDLRLHLRVHERRLAVTVVCDDFESDSPPSDPARSGSGLDGASAGGTTSTVATSTTVTEAAAIVKAISAAGGRLVFDRQADGRMRAQLSVPTS